MIDWLLTVVVGVPLVAAGSWLLLVALLEYRTHMADPETTPEARALATLAHLHHDHRAPKCRSHPRRTTVRWTS